MTISKQRKDELVEQYSDWLKDSDAIFLTSYTGMNVKQMQELRRQVHETESVFSVTKNTLLRLALKNSKWAVPEEMLTGQIASGFALGEAPTLAKKLVDFADDNEELVIKGGFMDGELLSAKQIESLASLPSIDQLRGQILGLLNTPAQNLAGVVASGMRQVLNVLDAYAKTEEGDVAPADV